MRWKRGAGRSRNVEDRRGERVRRGGGMRIPLPRGGMPVGGRKMGLGGVVLLLLLMFVMRNNPELFAGVGGPAGVQVPGGSGFPGAGPEVPSGPSSRSAGEDEAVEFVSFVIDDLNETWGRICCALIFIGTNATFFTQFVMGSKGMPRRYYDYIEQFTVYHQISTIGAYSMAVAFMIMAVYLAHSLFRGRPAPANPWGSATLEWRCTSPPPHDNFSTPPQTGDPYDYTGMKYSKEIHGYVEESQA